MPKRGRKKSRKLKIKTGSFKSFIAVLLFMSGLLGLVSLFFHEGALLYFVYDNLSSLFGYGVFIVCGFMLLLALSLFDFVEIEFITFKLLFGTLLAYFSFAGLSGILLSDSAGGKIGTEIALQLTDAISGLGGVVTLLILLFLSSMLVLNIPPEKLLGLLTLLASGFGSKMPKKDEKSPKYSDPLAEEDDDEEEIEKYETIKVEKPKEKPITEAPPIEVVQSSLEPHDSKPAKTNTQAMSLRETPLPGLPYTDKVWEYPPLELLNDSPGIPADRGDVQHRKQVIERTLSQFGIKARVAETNFGPAVTQYALEFTSVNKIAKVTNLQNDIALALASPTGSVRIEAPIPGKSMIGIEVPNVSTAIVNFRSMIAADLLKAAKSKLAIALGHNVAGQPCIADIAKMPHMLIAGSTGSGKSVFIHSILFSILYRCSPAECKLILVDPKRVELVNYNDIPHLMVPVITDAEKAPNAFKWAVAEMERRYKLFEGAKVRHINAYNELSGFQALPYIVIIVDELAELMALAPVDMEKAISRLAQLSRATGIHLVLATQSPRVDVITGLIKANIPTRVAFSVSSQIESRIIIDTVGAEKLLGKGDMLYVPPETSKPVRIQGVFVSDKEISNLVNFLKNSGVKPEYREEVMQVKEAKLDHLESSDDLFDEAVDIVMANDKASASLLQRKLSIGYARAARLLDELEAKGIVGPADGSKPRDVLVRQPESQSDSAPEDEL